MVCGIVGLLLSIEAAGIVVGVPALIMGYIAQRQIRHSGGTQGSLFAAVAGIVTGGFATGLSLVFWPILILVLRVGGYHSL